jgi:hypothetical protein
MKKINPLILCILTLSFLSTGRAYSQQIGDTTCGSLLLVSSWFNNNVKIYDGCSGNFIRNLDDAGRLNGPQAILELPDGDVLVVSEGNNELVRYDRETLSTGTPVLSGFVEKPVGAILDGDNQLYVVSYQENSVLKVDTQTWQVADTILAANNGLVRGADAGIALEGDIVYIPGYDSDNVITLNVASKVTNTLVSAGTGGLDAARGILIVDDSLYVTSERSNQILVFNKTSGAFIRSFGRETRPASIVQDGESHLLFSTRDAVYRAAIDGSSKETLVTKGAGGLNGATFVYRLNKNNFALDSDEDGLSDEDEINLHFTDPTLFDSDQDGLSDGKEVLETGSNPNLTDTDADGMPDGFEDQYSLLILQNDSDGDKDSDGLSNLLEFQTGTNPANADTDGDGLNDSVDAMPLTPSSIPALSGVPDEQIEQGVEYSFTPTLDYPGDVTTVQFSIENKPGWASFSEQNGLLLGEPKNEDVGKVSNIVISASNGFTTDSLDPFNIEVINVNDPPILLEAVTINGGSVLTSTAISTDLNSYFDDPDTGDSLTFTVADLPDGLTLSDQGVIAGNVSTVGQFTIVITVTDNAGASINANASLKVTAPSSPNAPVSQSSGGGALPIYGLLLLLGAICFKNKKLIWSRHSR